MKSKASLFKLEGAPARRAPALPPSNARAAQPHPAAILRRALAAPGSHLSRAEVRVLQRMMGNRGVTQLLAAPPARQEATRTGAARPPAQAKSLPPGLRRKMEESFAADFSDVRVRADVGPPRPGVLAFTQGEQINFTPGRYDPASREGQELIGHELAHVVQQREGRVGPTFKHEDSAVSEDPGLEAEADARGRRAAGGLAVPGRKSSGPARARSDGPVQEKNQFWGQGPVSQTVDNPIFAVANAVSADLAVSSSDVLKHLGGMLKIADTYKKELIKSGYQHIERPDKADAWLDTPPPKKGGRSDPTWISAYGNLGKVEEQIKGEPIQPYNGGHLIAWEFLGDAANVQGNIAPQAQDQNQALFRRLENTLTESLNNGVGGIEVTVKTTYNDDDYTVTYKDLIDRKLITDNAWINALTSGGMLANTIKLKQMAPDYYAVDLLTQTGVTAIATVDSRQQRNATETHRLVRAHTEDINRYLLTQKPKPLSILGTAVTPNSTSEDPSGYARYIYLNYRFKPGSIPQPTSVSTSGTSGTASPSVTVVPAPRRLVSVQTGLFSMALVVGILSALMYAYGIPFKEALVMVLAFLQGAQSPAPEGGQNP